MRVCCKCKKEKPLSEFATNNSRHGLDGKSRDCKECHRKYQKEWYKKNQETQLLRVSYHRNVMRGKKRKLLLNFLKDKKCTDCGETNPVVLQFDHVRGEKTKNIAIMINDGSSWNKILEEIAKCEIRCANCHMIKTAKQFGWHKYIDEVVQG